ncbi:UNVERIFIED_CONTAM: hypothetical protein FKN15_045747 [Acipenser sinensis]
MSMESISQKTSSRSAVSKDMELQDYEYPNQPQSVQYQKNDRCPPPPQMLPERACEVPSCRSDSECERHKCCCYNGCIYACLESVQPPPEKTTTNHEVASVALTGSMEKEGDLPVSDGFIPSVGGTENIFTGRCLRKLTYRNPGSLKEKTTTNHEVASVALTGSMEKEGDLPGTRVTVAEACSTTEDGDEPLHCPTGYECHIINPGNPAAGIPNRGQCIKQRGNSGVKLKGRYGDSYYWNEEEKFEVRQFGKEA